jgi:hypothetical protein
MLWGQTMKVFTDHANLMRDALGLTLDQVYQWRLLLEEYGLKIVYIKGIHNTVADAVLWLEYDPSVNRTAENIHMTKVRNKKKPSETKLDDNIKKLVQARHRLR